MKKPKRKASPFRRGFIKECEDYAHLYREDMGIAIHEPLPAYKLAENMNIELIRFEDFPLHQSEIGCLHNSISAATVRNKFGKPLILYNARHADARTESNIMHEIAHLILNHDTVAMSSATYGEASRHYDSQMELEAERLGSILQIPTLGLKTHLRQGKSKSEIALHFGASEKMVLFRYNTSGFLRQRLFLS